MELVLPMVEVEDVGFAPPIGKCASYHSSSAEGSAAGSAESTPSSNEGSVLASAQGSPIEPDPRSSDEDEPELSSLKPMRFLPTEAPRSGARPAQSPLPSQKKRRVSADARPNP